MSGSMPSDFEHSPSHAACARKSLAAVASFPSAAMRPALVLLCFAALLGCASASASSNDTSFSVNFNFELRAPAERGDFVTSIDTCLLLRTLAAVCSPPLNASDFTNASTFWDGHSGTFRALVGAPSSDDAQRVADLMMAAFRNSSLGDELRLNCFAVTASFRAVIETPASSDPLPPPAVDSCLAVPCTGHCFAASPPAAKPSWLAPILALLSMLASIASVASMFSLPDLRKNPFNNILAVMMSIQIVMGVFFLAYVALTYDSSSELPCSATIMFINANALVFYATVAWNCVFSAHFIISLRYPDLAKWHRLFRVYHIASWVFLALMCLFANLSHLISCNTERQAALPKISYAVLIVPIIVSYVFAIASLVTVVIDSGRIAVSFCERFKVVMRSLSFTNAYLFYTVWVIYFFSLQLDANSVASQSADTLSNIASASYGMVLSALWFSSSPFRDAFHRWRAGYLAEASSRAQNEEMSQTRAHSQLRPYPLPSEPSGKYAPASRGTSVSVFVTDVDADSDQYMSLDTAARD